jgi:ubiquinone/menaquinone biosynthesis C-methylase UbiE
VGLNEHLPLPDACADVVIEGWSFGHIMGWYGDDWQAVMDDTLTEATRILKPNGTLILIETLGTGSKQPQPPTERLAMLYEYWEKAYGYEHRWVRTDYQFESVAEAEHLTRFFFGDELADRVVREQLTILPECTGIWWWRKP